MKRILKWLGWLFVLVLVLGGAFFAHVWYFKPAKIEWFYNRVFFQFVLDDPELLSRLRMLEGAGITFHNDELTDASPQRQEQLNRRLAADYATLQSYDHASFTGQDALSYDILEFFLGNMVRGEKWQWHDFPVNQMYGVQSSLPNFMADVHQVHSEGDADDYVARLRKFPVKFAQVIDGLKIREGKGVIPPKFVVEKVLAQMRGFVDGGARKNPLYTTFVEKLDKLPAGTIDDAARTRLLADVEKAIDEAVFPAYAQLIAYFEALQPKATRNDGAWSLPDGDAYYAYQVAS
ncbi:MAG TPA: DUF885 family protein, partial [Xanthomonadales bacterium]|nr:DUF885 family protein [Xanthomonadales bacterium]